MAELNKNLKHRISSMMSDSIKNQYTTLIYAGINSEQTQEIFADSLARILIDEYDTTEHRLTALARILTYAEMLIRNSEERV